MLTRLLRDLFTHRRTGYVAFVADVAEPHRVTPETSLYSPQAAFRLRTLPAAQAVATMLPAWLVPPALAAEPGALERFGVPRALYIAKFMSGRIAGEPPLFSRLLRAVSASGVPTIADVTDDFELMPLAHELRPILVEWQAALGRIAHLTVTCAALKDSLARTAACGISVIEDPYEQPALGVARAPQPDPIRVCWFGNTADSTVPALDNALRSVAARFTSRCFAVNLVSAGRWELLQALVQRFSQHRNLMFETTEWSLQATWEALEHCDFVLLPHDLQQAWVRGKSHNRLVAAIAAGRLALASPIPSYVELGDYAWVDEDCAAGIEWALSAPDEARARVARGQAAIERRFSAEAVRGKWRALFRQVLGS